MCKVFIAVVLMAVAVYSAPHGGPGGAPPTADEIKAKLVAAGVSETAAAGLVAIGEKHKAELEAAKGDHAAAKTAFEAIKSESDTYIKTQSAADQTAYAAFIEKAKAEHEAHHGGHHGTTKAQ